MKTVFFERLNKMALHNQKKSQRFFQKEKN